MRIVISLFRGSGWLARAWMELPPGPWPEPTSDHPGSAATAAFAARPTDASGAAYSRARSSGYSGVRPVSTMLRCGHRVAATTAPATSATTTRVSGRIRLFRGGAASADCRAPAITLRVSDDMGSPASSAGETHRNRSGSSGGRRPQAGTVGLDPDPAVGDGVPPAAQQHPRHHVEAVDAQELGGEVGQATSLERGLRHLPHPPHETPFAAAHEQEPALALDDRGGHRHVDRRAPRPLLRQLVLEAKGGGAGSDGPQRAGGTGRAAGQADRRPQLHDRLVPVAGRVAVQELVGAVVVRRVLLPFRAAEGVEARQHAAHVAVHDRQRMPWAIERTALAV